MMNRSGIASRHRLYDGLGRPSYQQAAVVYRAAAGAGSLRELDRPTASRRLRLGGKRGHARRSGLTLIELVVSSISTMVLLAGLTSAIFIASRAVSPQGGAAAVTPTCLTLDEIAAEIRTLKNVYSSGSREITFRVDDRGNDADLIDETIRYSWDNVAGSSLMRTYNGTSTPVLSDVYQFSVTCLVQNDPTSKRILFVQGNVSGTEATYDNTRVQLMQSWGYTVLRKTTVSTTSQAELEAAAACADMIYVSTSLTANDLNTKLKSTTKPVIIEELLVADSFGLTTADGLEVAEKQIRVVDDTHFITAPVSTSLNIFASDRPIPYVVPTYAPGLRTLCRDKTTNTYPNLAILESGRALTDSSAASGLRLIVPWGGTGVNPADLTANGLALWRRVLDWASGKQYLSGVELSLRISSPTGPVLYSRAATIGRPRP